MVPCANATVGVIFVHGVRSRTSGWRAERRVELDRANSATERQVLTIDEHIAAVSINVGRITAVWTDGTHTSKADSNQQLRPRSTPSSRASTPLTSRHGSTRCPQTSFGHTTARPRSKTFSPASPTRVRSCNRCQHWPGRHPTPTRNRSHDRDSVRMDRHVTYGHSKQRPRNESRSNSRSR